MHQAAPTQMNIFSQYSDPHPFRSNSFSFDKAETSLSDAGSGTSASTHKGAQYSDEEVILASRTPKKSAGRRVFNALHHFFYEGIFRKDIYHKTNYLKSELENIPKFLEIF